MSETSKTIRQFLTTATVTIAVFALTLAARALTITTASDVMTNQAISAASDHRLRFVTPTGAAAGSTITVQFASGFNLVPLSSPGDFDLAQGSSGVCSTATFTDKTLGTTPSGATWGVAVSGQTVTFTSGTDSIPAGRCVEIEIGQNATFGTAGSGRIVNPGTAAQYSINIAGTFGDTGTIGVSIPTTGNVGVSAAVDATSTPAVCGNAICEPPTETALSCSADCGGGGGGGGGGVSPVISNVRAENVTGTEADLRWDTNITASSAVNYGTTVAYGSSQSTPGDVFNHTVHVSGLTPGTLYHYRVRSTSSGAPETVSGDFTFTTLDVSAPILSNIQAVNISATSARIIWDTNEDADSRVDYGFSEPYPSFVSSGVLTNAHSLVLTGLTPNSLYRYRVTSKDASNNSTTSVEFTFMTLDNVAPIISNITVDNITQTGARVNWTTNELADSRVEYGTTVSYGSLAQNGTLVANHQVTLTGLIPGTEYHFIVNSKDASANSATSTDQTFTTLPDVTPPTNVSNLTATPGDAQVALSWTNPSDPDFAGTRVRRKLGSFPTGPTDGTLVYQGTGTAHLDTGLTNGTTYYYAAFAYDTSNNHASGALASATPNDGVAPGPVSNFGAAAGNAQIQLTWTNPTDPDLAQVRIVRKLGSFPSGPADGTIAYQGLATSHLDTGLTNGTTYYYAAFAYDTSGNVSTPAYASATPVAPPPPSPICGNAVCEPPENNASCPADCAAPPPASVCGNAVCEAGETPTSCAADCAVTPVQPQPPVTPPVTPPVNRFDPDLTQYYSAGRTVRLQADDNGFYHTLIGQTLSVIIPDEAFRETPTQAVLNFGSSSYLLTRSPDGLRYTVDIQLQEAAASMTGTIIITYADGTNDSTTFDLSIDVYGRVFTRKEGRSVPVEGAVVTLEREINPFVTWDAATYAQTNPVTVGANGSFGYVVPSGTYRLVVTHADYRTVTTAPFAENINVINDEIELIAIPPSVTEVIVPGAPITENIFNVSRALVGQTTYITRIVQNEIINDPRVEQAARQVVIPAAAAVTAGVVITAVQVTTLINYLYFLVTQPILLLARRRRKEYGVIYNALTKLPVDLAIVRLYRTNGKLVRTIVTDKQGRYAFLVEEGSYRIEASRQNYTFPSQYLAGRKADAQYIDLYHGEEIVVGKSGAVITANIPLDPIEVVKSGRRLLLEDFGRKLQSVVALGSVIVTLVAFLFYRQLLLGIALVFQILLYMVFRRLARPRQPKNWGIIYDAKNRKPVPFAIARIIETQYNKVLESRVTDSRGRYNFLVGSNKYYVSVEKPGYETAKTTEIDLTKSGKEGGVVSLDIEIKPKP